MRSVQVPLDNCQLCYLQSLHRLWGLSNCNGTGQGSGACPAVWLSLVVILLNTLETVVPERISFMSADRSLQHQRLVVDAFINDTTIGLLTDNGESSFPELITALLECSPNMGATTRFFRRGIERIKVFMVRHVFGLVPRQTNATRNHSRQSIGSAVSRPQPVLNSFNLPTTTTIILPNIGCTSNTSGRLLGSYQSSKAEGRPVRGLPYISATNSL